MQVDAPAAGSAPAAPAAPAAAEAAPAAGAAAAEAADPYSAAASHLLTGSALEQAVNGMIEMGFPREEVMRAMRAAYNNPERAVEYLMSGKLVADCSSALQYFFTVVCQVYCVLCNFRDSCARHRLPGGLGNARGDD